MKIVGFSTDSVIIAHGHLKYPKVMRRREYCLYNPIYLIRESVLLKEAVTSACAKPW